MSHPTKLAPLAPVAASESAPPPLTLSELRILAAFRAMDPRRKEEALTRMARIAEAHPLHRAPLLRVVSGGAP